MFSVQIFQKNIFLKIKSNFSLTRKCFSLANFFNDKQTQKNLKNNFLKTTFQETNMVIDVVYSYGPIIFLRYFNMFKKINNLKINLRYNF